METIKPFDNEEESLQVGGITIENRLDRVSIYGSLDITRDKEGLERARQMKMVIDLVLKALESEKGLPDHIGGDSNEDVPNPFA